MKNIRLLVYISIIFIGLAILIFEDYTDGPPDYNEFLNEAPDFHTFKGLGIKVSTYPFVEIPGEKTSSSNDILLLRTSQIKENPELRNLPELPYNTIIILCDENWQTRDFLCTADNFESEIPNQNISIKAEENISIGYIEEGELRYFVLPEFLVMNIIRYPNLLNLTSSISNSQDIERTIVSNNFELGKQNGISFFPGTVLAALFIYLLIIYLLKLVTNKVNINGEAVTDLIPIISLIPFLILFFYTADALTYLQEGAKLTLERITGVNPDLIPNSVWLFIPLFLILVGFEFNVLLSKYQTALVRYTTNRLNPALIKSAAVVVLSYTLILSIRDTSGAMSQAILNSLFLALFLFILYIIKPFDKKDITLPFREYINNNTVKNSIRIFILLTLFSIWTLGYYYGHTKPETKNKVFFDPPKQYFTVPYSKLMRPSEVYHEYNIESPQELYIDDFIVSHPDYEEIDYSYQKLDSESKSFAYLDKEEVEAIKPLLSDSKLKALETQEPTSYFRLLTKGDIDSRVDMEITVKCVIESNSAITLQRYRLAYDQKNIITSTNTLYTFRKCNRGEEYSVRLVMRLADLSTYAYNDEILKVSYDGELIETKILIEDMDTQMINLNLNKKGKYVYGPYSDSKNLSVITAKESADNMKFIKLENKVNLGESFNLLRRRNLISNVVTINSLNKYTLIKYIK